jgi:hypothetical protein
MPDAPTLTMTVTVPLPYVEGQLTVHTETEYDDAVDVSAEHAAWGQPCANLRFSPGGPCEFVVLGWDAPGLRKLANFLIRASHAIEDEAKNQRARS